MVNEGLKFINPAGLNNPSSYGYTHVVAASPGSTTVYISGQYGADENGNLISDDFTTQLKQSFTNLRIALAAAGARPEDVVKITVLSVDHNEEKQRLISMERNAMWGDRKPASTLIPVPKLALDGMLFEIDAVAVIPEN
ncbi:MAG: RidA family protein [Scytonema hyalinum WJT4-NPBG1]|jgi:enamine deaminase RidA (YjgF/YER057c/UK114 family)|nr:RidA family protein [Scytonema hyalinum WJT4-NPBG1]